MAVKRVSGGWDVDFEHLHYKIRFQHDLLDSDARRVLDSDRPPARRLAVIDAEVWRLYHTRILRWLDGSGVPTRVLPLVASEATKTGAAVDLILNAAHEAGLGRLDELIAIGSGITLDEVGVAAGELRKGTPYVAIPTTLVGLIDAGVGAKRAVNHAGRKNSRGLYHPARLVLLDRTWLATTDERSISAGAAESLKVGEMVDPLLIDLWERHGEQLLKTRFEHACGHDVLDRSIDGILGHLGYDLLEKISLCRWPDHGHTLSPVLEMLTDGELRHGEAVNICSLVAAVLAASRGYVDADYPVRMVALARKLDLPTYHELLDDPAVLTRAVESAVATRGGHQHWPIPTRPGEGEGPAGTHAFLEDVDVPGGELLAATRRLRALTAAAA